MLEIMTAIKNWYSTGARAMVPQTGYIFQSQKHHICQHKDPDFLPRVHNAWLNLKPPSLWKRGWPLAFLTSLLPLITHASFLSAACTILMKMGLGSQTKRLIPKMTWIRKPGSCIAIFDLTLTKSLVFEKLYVLIVVSFPTFYDCVEKWFVSL